MKIGIMSDSHDQIQLMLAAAKAAVEAGAEAILHCGDVVAPSSLRFPVDKAKKATIPYNIPFKGSSHNLKTRLGFWKKRALSQLRTAINYIRYAGKAERRYYRYKKSHI